ncbi:hypothetical protein M9458_043587, partial [Cirrhinus mrigala]
LNPFGGMPNVPMSQAPMATRAASPINHQQININQVPTMNMSPTRMPPTQSMLGAHGGNMVAQTPNQTPFMAQPQFPANTNAMNVNMGQPNAQAAVSQSDVIAHDDVPSKLVLSLLVCVRSLLPQQQPNANLSLNALGPLAPTLGCPAPPQAPLRATPPPNATASTTNLPAALQPSQASTPTPAPAQGTPPHMQPQTELPLPAQQHPGTP